MMRKTAGAARRQTHDGFWFAFQRPKNSKDFHQKCGYIFRRVLCHNLDLVTDIYIQGWAVGRAHMISGVVDHVCLEFGHCIFPNSSIWWWQSFRNFPHQMRCCCCSRNRVFFVNRPKEGIPIYRLMDRYMQQVEMDTVPWEIEMHFDVGTRDFSDHFFREQCASTADKMYFQASAENPM